MKPLDALTAIKTWSWMEDPRTWLCHAVVTALVLVPAEIGRAAGSSLPLFLVCASAAVGFYVLREIEDTAAELGVAGWLDHVMDIVAPIAVVSAMAALSPLAGLGVTAVLAVGLLLWWRGTTVP